MDIVRTIRQTARALSRTRGMAILAVLTLALGIGSTTFMFSIVHGALYRGLPFPDGDEIFRVHGANRVEGWDRHLIQYRDYLALRESQTSFRELAAGYNGTVNVSTGEKAIRLEGAFLGANAFEVLRVQPMLGRGFRPGDDAPGAEPVLVLSYGTWRDEFSGDSDVIGRGVRINGESGSIVGVMPEGFEFPEVQQGWTPMRRSPTEERGTGENVIVYGRLDDGVSPEAAQAELAAIMSRLAVEYPETNEHLTVNILPFTEMNRATTVILLTMLGVVFLILLVACANVANLLLARTATRTREIAVRTALGARRGRLVAQLIAEAGLLALVGATLGAGGAWMATRWFGEALAHADPPFWFVFTVDGPILLFTVGVGVLAAVLAGVIPGLKATSGDIQVILQDDSRGSSSMRIGRLTRALVVGEIALSVGLLVVAGLMAKGIVERRNLELPFPTETIMTARFGLFESEYPDAEARQAVYDDVLRDLRSDPAIQAAALTTSLPGTGATTTRLAIQGESFGDLSDQPDARMALVSPGFFETFEAAAIRGRVIDERDIATTMAVAVINESFAAFHFGTEDPVGQQIRLGAAMGEAAAVNEAPWRTVIGVVKDMNMEGVLTDPDDRPRGLYIPLAQHNARFVSIAVRPRAASAPMSITPTVRQAVVRAAPDTPLYWVRTLQESLDQELWPVNVFGGIMITFGLVALVMAVAGLYGVTSFAVGRRTHEVGIRMAMGAAAHDVLRLVFKQGVVQIAIGLFLGLALAVVLAMAMQQVLFRVEPLDPVVWTGITVLLAVTALTASAIPAIRASRVDPAHALRRD